MSDEDQKRPIFPTPGRYRLEVGSLDRISDFRRRPYLRLVARVQRSQATEPPWTPIAEGSLLTILCPETLGGRIDIGRLHRCLVERQPEPEKDAEGFEFLRSEDECVRMRDALIDPALVGRVFGMTARSHRVKSTGQTAVLYVFHLEPEV